MVTFTTNKREEWRNYLLENFNKLTEILFVYPLNRSEEDCLSYNDIVEEALCFGWIDSTNYKIDETHRALRLTPRRKGSKYSQLNIERLIWLSANNLIHESVKEDVLSVINKPFIFPKDIIKALKKDEIVWKNFASFNDSYKRIRIAHIESVRNKPDEFKKRLNNFINKTKEGKIIQGTGGVEKYYR